jgi:hypothetical protein
LSNRHLGGTSGLWNASKQRIWKIGFGDCIMDLQSVISDLLTFEASLIYISD